MKYLFKQFIDKKTGRMYERISPEGVLCHYPYFYLNMIDKTTNRLILIMKKNSCRNVHLLNLDSRNLEQVTFYNKEHNFSFFSPRFIEDGKALVYAVDNKIVKHTLADGNIELLYKPEEGWDTYTAVEISTDEKYLITIDFPIKDYINRDNGNWETFIEQGKRGLRSKLIRVDLHTNKSEVLIDTKDYDEKYGLKKNQWLGHPQFMPGRSDVISYCHEGYGGTVDARIWLYYAKDGSVKCPRVHENKDEIISHEFFTHDGKKIGFVRIENDESDQGSLRFVDVETLSEEIAMELPRCSHFMTNNTDEYIIADADYPAELYLHFVDIVNKKHIPLLLHNSSMKSYGTTQDAHPHPIFSPDNQYVFFVSDMEGYPAVYRANVSDLVNIKN